LRGFAESQAYWATTLSEGATFAPASEWIGKASPPRTQSGSIFDNTETCHQADLVCMLGELPDRQSSLKLLLCIIQMNDDSMEGEG
jgi:hypothetical protein